MIHEACVLMKFGGSAEGLGRRHVRPTMSEAAKEAAMAVDGRAIHVWRQRSGGTASELRAGARGR